MNGNYVLRRPKRSKIEVVAPKDEEESVSPLLNYVLKRFVLAILGYFIQNYKENRQIPCHTF